MVRTSIVVWVVVCAGCLAPPSGSSSTDPYPECPIILDWLKNHVGGPERVDRQGQKTQYVFLKVDEWGRRSEGFDNYSADPHVHIWLTYSFEIIKDGKHVPQAQVKGRMDLFRGKVTDFTPWG